MLESLATSAEEVSSVRRECACPSEGKEVLELKEETKIAVEYSLHIFRYFPEIRFIVLVCSKI